MAMGATKTKLARWDKAVTSFFLEFFEASKFFDRLVPDGNL